MALWLSAGLGIGLFTGLRHQSMVGSLASLFLPPIGFIEEYLRAYSRARGLAHQGEEPPPAAFILVGESRPLFMPYLAMGVGLAGGLYAIGFAWSHYSELPTLVPVHLGLLGKPDGWRPRSIFSAMMPSILCLIILIAVLSRFAG